ncbi:MAG TPA: hypothetical protein VJN00_11785 [Steroidobacteraceae bacterium]|jgi:hypothetical protein|nr:hypothetical protein [Steroidobacteraceae bacterium]
MIFFRIRTTNRLHPDYLEIACSGPYSRAESQRVGLVAFREAALAERDTVLLDVRQVAGKIPSILERFEMGVHIAKHYRESEPRIRLAVLGSEPMIHPDRFGELVARNRGADARVFTVEAEALAWVRRLR